MNREEYEAAVNSLYARTPSLSEDEVLVGMMRIVAMIKDGHTNIIPREYFRSGVFPSSFMCLATASLFRKPVRNMRRWSADASLGSVP
jgi:hypothetical protein